MKLMIILSKALLRCFLVLYLCSLMFLLGGLHNAEALENQDALNQYHLPDGYC